MVDISSTVVCSLVTNIKMFVVSRDMTAPAKSRAHSGCRMTTYEVDSYYRGLRAKRKSIYHRQAEGVRLLTFSTHARMQASILKLRTSKLLEKCEKTLLNIKNISCRRSIR